MITRKEHHESIYHFLYAVGRSPAYAPLSSASGASASWLLRHLRGEPASAMWNTQLRASIIGIEAEIPDKSIGAKNRMLLLFRCSFVIAGWRCRRYDDRSHLLPYNASRAQHLIYQSAAYFTLPRMQPNTTIREDELDTLWVGRHDPATR